MSASDNRLGRNPFDKKSKPSKASTSMPAEKASKAKKASSSNKPATPITVTATAAKSIQKEQIIGEMIDLPEETWQPLTFAPAGLLKELLARWL